MICEENLIFKGFKQFQYFFIMQRDFDIIHILSYIVNTLFHQYIANIAQHFFSSKFNLSFLFLFLSSKFIVLISILNFTKFNHLFLMSYLFYSY